MPHPDPSPDPIQTCPFCAIAAANPPSALRAPPSSSTTSPPPTSPHPPDTTTPSTHLLLSTPLLLAFLDHAPISRGHVLLVVRTHREKLGDVSIEEGEGVGRWLGVLSRAVVGAVGEGEEMGDWNVVQNNGARAAQVVPHVHFHVIPRVGDVPEVKARSWTVFGKGQREELDEDDARVLVGRIRERLRGEVERVRKRDGEEAFRRLVGEGVENVMVREGGRGKSKL